MAAIHAYSAAVGSSSRIRRSKPAARAASTVSSRASSSNEAGTVRTTDLRARAFVRRPACAWFQAREVREIASRPRPATAARSAGSAPHGRIGAWRSTSGWHSQDLRRRHEARGNQRPAIARPGARDAPARRPTAAPSDRSRAPAERAAGRGRRARSALAATSRFAHELRRIANTWHASARPARRPSSRSARGHGAVRGAHDRHSTPKTRARSPALRRTLQFELPALRPSRRDASHARARVSLRSVTRALSRTGDDRRRGRPPEASSVTSSGVSSSSSPRPARRGACRRSPACARSSRGTGTRPARRRRGRTPAPGMRDLGAFLHPERRDAQRLHRRPSPGTAGIALSIPM